MKYSNYTLEEVCEKITDGSHFSPKAEENGYPMLSVKDMDVYDFNYSNCKYISETDYLKMVSQDCIPQTGDVLVAKDGSYLKSILVIEENKKIAILSSIAIFRPNRKYINSYYLKYMLLNPSMKKMITDNYVSGSALPRIVLKDFKKIKLNIPDVKYQNKIVSLMKVLDDKIILNTKLNDNLIAA